MSLERDDDQKIHQGVNLSDTCLNIDKKERLRCVIETQVFVKDSN